MNRIFSSLALIGLAILIYAIISIAFYGEMIASVRLLADISSLLRPGLGGHNLLSNETIESGNVNLEGDHDYCKWTVITGDSNHRNTYEKWLALEQRKEYAANKIPSSATGGAMITTTVIVANRSLLIMNKDKCRRPPISEISWSDKEFVILTTGART